MDNRVTRASFGGGAVAALLLAAAARANGSELEAATQPLDSDALARSALVFETLLGLGAIAAATFSREPLARRLGVQPGRLPAGVLFALIAGTLGFSFAIDGLIEITGLDAYSHLGDFERSLAGLRGGSLLLAFGVFAVAAGVGEELLCRGWLQRGLQARFGAIAAILVSSLVFGAMHLEPVHAIAAGLLGGYLGCVAWLADSVRASIACHIANNATAVAVAAMDWPLPATTPAAITGAAIAAVGTLVWAVRRVGAPRRQSPAPGGPPTDETGGPPDPVSLQPDPGSADA